MSSLVGGASRAARRCASRSRRWATAGRVLADGTKVLVRSDDVAELANIDPSTAVRLLPGFDPYTLSLQKEAEPLLPLARRPLVPGPPAGSARW